MKHAIYVFSIFYFLFSATVMAEVATVYIDPGEGALLLGQEYEAKVLVDATQALNAYSVAVGFDPAQLEFVRTDTSRSIIDIWQTLPDASREGTITFNGASITPFTGVRGQLFSIWFRARESLVSTTIRVGVSAVYLANGKGTKVIPDIRNASFARAEAGDEALLPYPEAPSEDTSPPTITFLELAKDPINPEHKLLGFSVRDEGTGIREVRARSRTWFFWSESQPAQNPMAYPGGVWAVQFTAIDHAGNTVERTIYDTRALIVKLASVTLVLVVLWGAAHLRARLKLRSAA
jgi:hypothetical protein